MTVLSNKNNSLCRLGAPLTHCNHWLIKRLLVGGQRHPLWGDSDNNRLTGRRFSEEYSEARVSEPGTGVGTGLFASGRMNTKALDEVLASMTQACEPPGAARAVLRAAQLDTRATCAIDAHCIDADARSIKELRGRTKLTQSDFAALLGVELSTLRNWEQGRRVPTGPARALLRALRNDPQNVIRALARAAQA